MTNHILEEFENQGFAVIRKCVNKKNLNCVKKYLKEEKIKELSKLKKIVKASNQSDLINKISAIKRKSKLKQYFSEEQCKSITGHFPLEVRLSKLPLKLISKKTLGIFKNILSTDNIYVHWPTCSRFVIPQNSFAMVPAHVDSDYNQHMQSFFTCWIPLVPINDKCGGVSFFNHKHNDSQAAKNNGLWLKRIDTKNMQPISPKMNVGDILIFNNKVIHESRFNSSNYTRYSVDMRFFGNEQLSNKHYYDFSSKQVRINL